MVMNLLKTPSTNELLRKADLQLLHLQQEIEQMQSAIAQAQARLDQINRAAGQRSEELTTSHNYVHACVQDVERTQSYAELATDTRQEREANLQLKQAQSALAKVQARYEEDMLHATQEQKKEDEQAESLSLHLSKRQQELQDLCSRQRTVSAAREQAFLSRGRDLHQTALEAIHRQQARIMAIERCVDQERQTLAQLLTKTLEELADYPDLAREIRTMQPIDDATSRVMQSALVYIDTLLAERGGLPDRLTLPSTKYVSPFSSLFEIPAEEVWKGVNIRENPAGLLNRRERLTQVLTEYQESQRDL